MGFEIMGTDHLKARCICQDYGQGIVTIGCPIHEKPTPVPDPGVDMVNHPPHYSSDAAGVTFDCIAIVRDLGFDVGNAVKYLWRTELKNGVEDIEKARWYLHDAVKWNTPFYIGNTPMQFNARCAALIRAQEDPLRRRFFQALRAQSAQWMLEAVDDMLTSIG